MPSKFLNPDELAALGQVVSPIRDVGVLAQQGAALALGQPAPNTELDAIIQGVSAAFG